jgi:non-ribosomal peptide synthetase component F
LNTLQTDSVNALAHQNCSLADVQHELQLPALFNSAFTFQRRQLSTDPDVTALVYENMEAEDPGEYALTINADVGDESISVDFGFWMDKVCLTQAQNMADSFEKILHEIISNDSMELTVGKLDVFTSSSLRQVMTWNANVPPPISRCVHEVIHEQALLRPRTTKAVDGHDGTFTYQEFDKLTDQLATHLQSIGVTTETFVPLLFDKSSWAITSMIAIMKAGGAYVPLDPKHPESRLRELITDVGAKVVLCSRNHQARASEVAVTAVVVDAQAVRKLRMPSAAKPASMATPDNAAYCLFTSGTTGKPKGTIIPHQAFCTSAAAFTRRMNINATSRTFQFASYTFDASCIEILSALTVGATVCVPSEAERMNDPAGAIRRLKATWSLLTPSVLGTIEPDRVSCLKTIVSGGEALPGPIMKKWGTSICFINGMLLFTSFSTVTDIQQPMDLQNAPSSLPQHISLPWIINCWRPNLEPSEPAPELVSGSVIRATTTSSCLWAALASSSLKDPRLLEVISMTKSKQRRLSLSNLLGQLQLLPMTIPLALPVCTSRVTWSATTPMVRSATSDVKTPKLSLMVNVSSLARSSSMSVRSCRLTFSLL